MRKLSAFLRDDGGASAAEFTLILPVFLLFLLGIIVTLCSFIVIAVRFADAPAEDFDPQVEATLGHGPAVVQA